MPTIAPYLLALIVSIAVVPAVGRAEEGEPSPAAVPSRIGGFLREAAGYLRRSDHVDVGDPAPDFELVPLRFYDFDLDVPDLERNALATPYRGVQLSSFRGVRPVALIFGSYT